MTILFSKPYMTGDVVEDIRQVEVLVSDHGKVFCHRSRLG